MAALSQANALTFSICCNGFGTFEYGIEAISESLTAKHVEAEVHRVIQNHAYFLKHQTIKYLYIKAVHQVIQNNTSFLKRPKVGSTLDICAPRELPILFGTLS